MKQILRKSRNVELVGLASLAVAAPNWQHLDWQANAPCTKFSFPSRPELALLRIKHPCVAIALGAMLPMGSTFRRCNYTITGSHFNVVLLRYKDALPCGGTLATNFGFHMFGDPSVGLHLPTCPAISNSRQEMPAMPFVRLQNVALLLMPDCSHRNWLASHLIRLEAAFGRTLYRAAAMF